MNIGRVIKRLYEMEQEAYRVGITIQQKLSDQAVGDARPSAFYKLAQLFRACKIYFILREEYLPWILRIVDKGDNFSSNTVQSKVRIHMSI
jgi:hypothetical protein